MLIVGVNYEQFKKIKDVFGARYKVFYTLDEMTFVSTGAGEGYAFALQYISDVKPSTFDVDFPTALQVISL